MVIEIYMIRKELAHHLDLDPSSMHMSITPPIIGQHENHGIEKVSIGRSWRRIWLIR